VERIEDLAFAGTALKSIVIPVPMPKISNSSFASCRKLESVRLENGEELKGIGREGCHSGKANWNWGQTQCLTTGWGLSTAVMKCCGLPPKAIEVIHSELKRHGGGDEIEGLVERLGRTLKFAEGKRSHLG
jgi:hypothetical protein